MVIPKTDKKNLSNPFFSYKAILALSADDVKSSVSLEGRVDAGEYLLLFENENILKRVTIRYRLTTSPLKR